MKSILFYQKSHTLSRLLIIILFYFLVFPSSGFAQKFRHIDTPKKQTAALVNATDSLESYKSWARSVADSTFTHTVSSLDSLSSRTPPVFNITLGPWIFSGYRSIPDEDAFFSSNVSFNNYQQFTAQKSKDFNVMGSSTPDWLKTALRNERIQKDFIYKNMIQDYTSIQCAYWNLPEPPKIPDEDYSFNGYLKRLKIEITPTPVKINVEDDLKKKHWLHVLNTGLQFSQAYVSSNWYQGGANSISILFNFLWDVTLNTVYHPRHIFQSSLSYKLGVISTNSENSMRKYSISDDIFQYNLRAGYKAVHNWFYSCNLQFKTQMLSNYPVDSQTRTASFLSPGELNVGAGMTYSKENAAKTLLFNASIAPISYQLITCIDDKVDPTAFKMAFGSHTKTSVGSNAEVTFKATVWGNVTYNTRLFLFTSYKQFTGDWENTLVFRINSFLTSQIYTHLRYDTSPTVITSKWKKLMLKEILSFGLSYYFSTKRS